MAVGAPEGVARSEQSDVKGCAKPNQLYLR